MEQPYAEQERHKWLLDEEEEIQEEETTLVGRHSREHPKDNVNPGVGDAVSLVGTNTEVPYGPLVQKEEHVAEIENISENGHHCDGDKVDSAALLERTVAEKFAGAAANGDAVTSVIGDASMNENSVYFDHQEGIEANNCSSGVQNGDGAQSDLPTNPGDGEFSVQEEKSDIQNILCNGVSIQCVKSVEDKGPSGSENFPFDNSSEVNGVTFTHIDDRINTNGSPDLIEEIGQQLEDLDVEAVLEKQETHDLFCPNCHSCITKRVILRKRKRHSRNLDSKAKRDKSNDAISSEPIEGSTNEANQGDQAITNSDVANIEPPADHNSPEREAEVFRCLSCFSFFIPKVNHFWDFGGARERETLQNPLVIPVSNTQNPSDIPAAKANWFLSLFTPNKGKTTTRKGIDDAAVDHPTTGPAEQNHSSSIPSNMPSSPEIGYPRGPISDTNTTKNVQPISNIKPEYEGTDSLTSSAADSVTTGLNIKEDFKFSVSSGNESLADKKSPNSLSQNDSSFKQTSTQIVGDMIDGVQKAGHDLIDFSANEHFLVGNVGIDVGEKTNDWAVIPKTGSPILGKSCKEDIEKIPDITTADESIAQNSNSSLMQGKEPLESDAATNIRSSGVEIKISPKQNFILVEKARAYLGEDPASSKEKKVDEVAIFVGEEGFKSTRSQTAANVPVGDPILTETPTQLHVGDQTGAQNAEPRGWEILKSIVYGGLIESITSLGIVSSAVGSGASPLNIIALGLANLIGGLFIIIDNLLELKNSKSGGHQQQTNTQQEDRYQELLGRRSNFILHAVVAVLSFIIFGTVPIAIYSVLIRKNYSSEIKLAAVGTASLICIILLAIGKVYTKRSPKSYFKTVFYCVTMALAVAGVSNVVGGLIKDLLGKFSKSESGFVIEMPFSSTGRMEPARMSY